MSDPNPARILIVDDDVAHAESLQDALELDGYLCAVVHGGAEALEVLREQVEFNAQSIARVESLCTEILRGLRGEDARLEV